MIGGDGSSVVRTSPVMGPELSLIVPSSSLVTEMSNVPSVRQNASVSSDSSRLHLGQRFIKSGNYGMTFELSSVLCTLGFVFDVFTPEEWNVYRSRNVISGTPLGVRCLDLCVFDSSS